MDLGIKVMLGISWVFAVIQIAPVIVYPLIEQGSLPRLGSLSASASEFVYVGVLAAVGPVVIWLLSRQRRRKEWEGWDE
jgi:hypothetical protein